MRFRVVIFRGVVVGGSGVQQGCSHSRWPGARAEVVLRLDSNSDFGVYCARYVLATSPSQQNSHSKDVSLSRTEVCTVQEMNKSHRVVSIFGLGLALFLDMIYSNALRVIVGAISFKF